MAANRLRIVGSAVGFAVLTNGPVFFAQRHLLRRPVDFESPLALVCFGGVGLAGAVLFVRLLASRPSGRTRRVTIGWALAATWCALAIASNWWSVASAASSIRGLIYLGLAGFGAWFATALSRREQIVSIAVAFQSCVLASTVALVVGGSVVLQEGNHRWRGLYTNSNSFGPVCGLAALSVAALAIHAVGGRRWFLWALVAGDVVVLAGTQSVTAVLATAIAAASTVVLLMAHRSRLRGVTGRLIALKAGMGVVAVAAVLAVAGSGRIGSWLRGDPTLSHRTRIWGEVRELIAMRPLHGWGFQGFWERFDLAAPVYWRVGLVFGSAHNSFLEVALGLGVIGLVLYVAIVALAGYTVVGLWWWAPSVWTSCWVAIFVFLLVESQTESFILWYSYHWPLLVAMAAMPALAIVGRRPFATVIVRTQGQRPEGLSAAIACLDAQTNHDFEVVVAVHGTRRTLRRVQAQLADRSIRFVRTSRPGRGAPLNDGLTVARGRYATFLDDDDLVTPDWIECFATADPSGPPVMLRALARSQQWDATPHGDPKLEAGPVLEPFERDFCLAAHLRMSQTPICSVAVPMNVIRGRSLAVDESLPVLEDIDLLLRIAFTTEVRDIGAFTSLVRRHDDSNSRALHGADEWVRTRVAMVERLRVSTLPIGVVDRLLDVGHAPITQADPVAVYA